LEVAEEWGTPPHILFGGSVFLWWQRWKTRREFLLMKASGDKENDG
jgi:hypothetical protein